MELSTTLEHKGGDDNILLLRSVLLTMHLICISKENFHLNVRNFTKTITYFCTALFDLFDLCLHFVFLFLFCVFVFFFKLQS